MDYTIYWFFYLIIWEEGLPKITINMQTIWLIL